MKLARSEIDLKNHFQQSWKCNRSTIIRRMKNVEILSHSHVLVVADSESQLAETETKLSELFPHIGTYDLWQAGRSAADLEECRWRWADEGLRLTISVCDVAVLASNTASPRTHSTANPPSLEAEASSTSPPSRASLALYSTGRPLLHGQRYRLRSLLRASDIALRSENFEGARDEQR